MVPSVYLWVWMSTTAEGNGCPQIWVHLCTPAEAGSSVVTAGNVEGVALYGVNMVPQWEAGKAVRKKKVAVTSCWRLALEQCAGGRGSVVPESL